MRRYLVLAVSLLALGLAGYVGYSWYFSAPHPEPTPPDQPPARVDTGPVDVPLPDQLQEQLRRDRAQRKQFFARALEAHSAGEYEQAIELYRRTIAHSGRDSVAARSYRYLGDIYERAGQYEQAIRLYKFAIDVEPTSSIFHYRLGRAYQAQGKDKRAESAFREAIERDARPLYYLALGNLRFENRDYSAAANSYETGLEAGEEYRDRLLVNLGRARQLAGESEAALEAYRRALDQDLSPDLQYRVRFNRGVLLRKLDRPDRAVREFERARALRETVDLLYNLGLARLDAGNTTGAVDALEVAYDQQGGTDPRIAMDLGYAYYQIGDVQRSLRYYRQALEQRSDDPRLHLAVARLYEENNQPREALTTYRELLQLVSEGPMLRLALRRVGELYLDQGAPEKAAPAFRNFLRLDEDNHEVHYNLALAYRRSGELERAIDQFERALELQSGSTDYRMALADTLFRAGFRKRARSVYEEVSHRTPGRVQAQYMVAYLDYTFGDHSRARKEFQALLGRLQGDTGVEAKVYQALGNIYLKESEYSRARTAYRKALERSRDPAIYYNHGLVAVNQKNWDVALSSFRQALELRPDNANFRAALGMVLYQKGLYREARRQLEQALQLQPDHLRAQYNLKRVEAALRDIRG